MLIKEKLRRETDPVVVFAPECLTGKVVVPYCGKYMHNLVNTSV